MNPLPTLFLSHGSPMHAIESGAAGDVWAALAKALPKPSAVLMVTAHWETQLPMVSGNPQPSMIYDFGGFPEALSKIRYAAPGDPGLAARAQSLLKAAGITAGIDGCRGFDHGTWVPLLRLYPAADVPVVQLSVQPSTDPLHHLEVGRALAPLRDEGVLIVGSGHLTHNLRDWMASRRGGNHASNAPYAVEFQAWVKAHLDARDVDGLTRYRSEAPGAVRAHPTEEHFLPLFVAVGAAGRAAKATRVFDGFEGGALAMDAYRFD
ncbi:MAG: dioxygenase [Betaproteobacteria bacterium]|nr:dioxygenase [Betaproteobacteria bacterium]